MWRDEKPDEKPGDVVFPDQEESNWAFDEKAGRWYLHRFYSHQPDLNVSNPDVRDEIAQIAGFWLEQGISGFRVDAVPFLIEPVGLPSGAISDPHELLRDVRSFIGRRRGDSVLLGEVNLPPGDQRKFFGDEGGDELQLLFSFTVNQAMYLALAREQAAPLARALEALPPIPTDCQWANFVRNHDELTLDKLSDAERQEVFAAFGPDEELQLYGRGLRRRLPTMLEGDQRRIRMVYSLVFSLPGHAGSLLRRGDRHGREPRHRGPLQRAGADAVVRRAAGGVHRLRASLAVRSSRAVRSASGEVNVARQRRDPDALLNWMERLIRRRRECPELGWGRLDAARPRRPKRCSPTGSTGSGPTVVAVHNLADREGPGRAGARRGRRSDRPLRRAMHALEDGAVTLALDPYDARWFRLRRPGQRLPP